MSNIYQEERWKSRGHVRKPNKFVLGLYSMFDLIQDFGPMFSSMGRGIRKAGSTTWGFFTRSIMLFINFALVVGIIYLSVGHSYTLLVHSGFSGVAAWVAVAVWEAVFIYCSMLIDNAHRNKRKVGWAAWIGFLMGFAFVGISNYMGMASNTIGKIIGISTPILLLVMKKVLEHQFKNEPAEEQKNTSWFSSVFKSKTIKTTPEPTAPSTQKSAVELTAIEHVETETTARNLSKSTASLTDEITAQPTALEDELPTVKSTTETTVEILEESTPENEVETLEDTTEDESSTTVESTPKTTAEILDQTTADSTEDMTPKSTALLLDKSTPLSTDESINKTTVPTTPESTGDEESKATPKMKKSAGKKMTKTTGKSTGKTTAKKKKSTGRKSAQPTAEKVAEIAEEYKKEHGDYPGRPTLMDKAGCGPNRARVVLLQLKAEEEKEKEQPKLKRVK
ncbi:hypothetical protein [Shimazuella kribbensis]|uniref:hypothetical protein n=1 Tax=Shimazuella kribbensis TaxID=139808 RepID=UPI0004902E6E|nr:hypothetical protein [Shimazuella kribbensis]